MRKEIKICGTRSVFDLETTARAGADAAGIICARGRISRHTVDPHRAAWLVRCASDVTSVLVPRSTDPAQLVDLAKRIKPDRIQLGETEDRRLVEALFGMSDRPKIAQVFHIGENTDPGVMDGFLDFIDYVHLDSSSPDRPGGTGITHDWQVSREMAVAAHAAGKMVLLAGGLTADNVREAIESVEPDGVDVESSIKDSFGAHDEHRVERFIHNARAAFEELEMVG